MSDYTENERRLLTLAAQREIELREFMQLAAETVRELTVEIDARDATIDAANKRLAEIAELCIDDVIDICKPRLRKIKAIARGE